MALTKKSSPTVVLVMLILAVTQPVYSQAPPPPPGPHCKLGCFLRCIASIYSPTFITCVGGCLVGICGTQIKALSNPSFHCGVGCIRSKCYLSGAEDGNKNKQCISSCVGECDTSFAGDLY